MSREESRQVRDWAREQGYELADRGRIPNHVVEAWEKSDQKAAA